MAIIDELLTAGGLDRMMPITVFAMTAFGLLTVKISDDPETDASW
ncbi:hypothetical protein AGMMS49944_00940 [Spirochaetia bacterium]|nr:hypothetical protein AGMMS49944_00940 [Spirochaetia bacterium]